MKIAFVVYNDVYGERVMETMEMLGVDYFTRWDEVKGKGHGTEAHLGTRIHPGTNAVLMIAFQDEAVLDKLLAHISTVNEGIVRTDDKVRIFQLPLERML
jgi:hypothetical protein